MYAKVSELGPDRCPDWKGVNTMPWVKTCSRQTWTRNGLHWITVDGMSESPSNIWWSINSSVTPYPEYGSTGMALTVQVVVRHQVDEGVVEEEPTKKMIVVLVEVVVVVYKNNSSDGVEGRNSDNGGERRGRGDDGGGVGGGRRGGIDGSGGDRGDDIRRGVEGEWWVGKEKFLKKVKYGRDREASPRKAQGEVQMPRSVTQEVKSPMKIRYSEAL
ncbi:hypothetical protein FXO38_18638 [Capsicum annuum]|nr:hypothetical protein FXO38_18638 [Capsicum annuum]